MLSEHHLADVTFFGGVRGTEPDAMRLELWREDLIDARAARERGLICPDTLRPLSHVQLRITRPSKTAEARYYTGVIADHTRTGHAILETALELRARYDELGVDSGAVFRFAGGRKMTCTAFNRQCFKPRIAGLKRRGLPELRQYTYAELARRFNQ